ncbi:16S rRNA (cytosine(967)-C(5))-methyltransferase [Lusitaniella coriacea]|uniref:16S rRNA (cytosine(967)-C(5))-methyltransferase n=1 Tax=Lusitaniella coriacea TaxID=1983105 RepID=UPI003CF28217
MSDSRQLAFVALRQIYQRGAYTDVALDRVLHDGDLDLADRGLLSELVYGVVRRARSLDALIDQLGKKKARQQPPDLRAILHLGLYQLRYLDRVPDSAAVNTSVELAKNNGLKRLAGVVNGILRQYSRLAEEGDPLVLPEDAIARLGILHSYPDWIVQLWVEQFGTEEAERLGKWFNQPPSLDLRVNPLNATLEDVERALNEENNSRFDLTRVPPLPQALRLKGKTGAIAQLPGFKQGWWTVQDSSAQLVVHLLDPQPGEVIIDACAAPGGKTTHIAELMRDRGTIWARDRAEKRLRKVRANAQRLQLQSIQLSPGDSCDCPPFHQTADRVLVDAPCSGLGTLHRHPDIRWRQTPEKLDELTTLQNQLLSQTALWVKPGGILVYATCTLNPAENETLIQSFLDTHADWTIEFPSAKSIATPFASPDGWIKVLPTQHHMDGFFMVKLKKSL